MNSLTSSTLEVDFESDFDEEEVTLLQGCKEGTRNALPRRSTGNVLLIPLLFCALIATVSTGMFLMQKNSTPLIECDPMLPDGAHLVQTTESLPPSMCAQLLDGNATNVPESVRLVLKSHCELNPYLPLEKMIPNMTIFERVYGIMSRYKREYNTTISLMASRGSTGTRGTIEWIRATGKYGVFHYAQAECPVKPDKEVTTCMQTHAMHYIDNVHAVLRENLFENRTISQSEYAHLLLDPFLEHLDKILSCGNCGHLVLSDTPWVPNFFAEFYLAGGPETKVILNRREGTSWAHSRQQHNEIFGCIPNEGTKDLVLDPFSYTQCNGNGVVKDIRMLDELQVQTMLNQYDAYVHRYVQDDLLLDLNLFTSKLLHPRTSNEDSKETWSRLNKELVEAFLFNGE